MDHKHTWKRSPRQHGNPNRLFVTCQDPECGITRQATTTEGHLHVFHTGRKREKSRVVSYRLKPWQENKLHELGMSFVEFVDQAFLRR